MNKLWLVTNIDGEQFIVVAETVTNAMKFAYNNGTAVEIDINDPRFYGLTAKVGKIRRGS